MRPPLISAQRRKPYPSSRSSTGNWGSVSNTGQPNELAIHGMRSVASLASRSNAQSAGRFRQLLFHSHEAVASEVTRIVPQDSVSLNHMIKSKYDRYLYSITIHNKVAYA
jgi:hypothetical protein